MAGFPDRSGYALVTGGATRIGASLVRRLADEGWPVAIHYRQSAADAAALADEVVAAGGRAEIVSGDLSRPDVAREIFTQSDRAFGFCSLLVNNASVFEYDDIGTIDPQSMDAHYAVNLRAPMLLSRAFAKRLPNTAKGLIVNLLDQKVDNLNPDFLSYTLTKCALADGTKLLALALAPRIRVCGISPGLSLRSNRQTEEGFAAAHTKTPLGFGSGPEDMANALSFLCNTEALTGIIVTVDAGQSLVRRPHDVMFSYGIAPDAPVGPEDE